MEAKNETGHVNRKLLAKHLDSVVGIRVCRQIEVAKKMGGIQEQEGQHEGKEDGKQDKAGAQRQTLVYHATGSIIHVSDNFALVLSCAHTFAPFCKHGAAALDQDIRLDVDFFDGYSTIGNICQISCPYDLSIVLVFLDGNQRGAYRAVKFTESSCLMGFTDTERDAVLHSIICFPANQERALFGTAVSGKICGPPRLGKDVDPDLHSGLQMVQFEMSGADGCSGAPLFTQNLGVLGIWISHVGDIKFGVLVDSICEWLRRTFNVKERSIKLVVSKIGAIYSENFALLNEMEN